MSNALETMNLGKRYGRGWALRDCTVQLPTGRVAALVGPNGAGKTTLLHLAVGLLEPTAGSVRALGYSPSQQPRAVLSRIGFLAQDRPLYHGFTVGEMLTFGRKLNPRWDASPARERLARLGIPLDRRVARLSGGQQAQVALALALAKRPELLLLDEPVASLDPLARREFLRALMDATSADGLTVLLSSHIIADLEQVCDYLIILSAAHVQLAGDIGEIVRSHKLLTGPRREAASVAGYTVVEAAHAREQTTLLVRAKAPTGAAALDPAWAARDVSLEEIVLAYLGQPAAGGAWDAAPLATEQSEMEVSR